MRALVLSVTAGQGHNSTAKALCTYLESVGCEAKMLDTLSYVNPVLGETVSKGYLITASKAKLVYKGGYRLAEKRKKSSSEISPSREIVHLLARKVRRYLDGYDPDIVICTHVFAAIIMDILKVRNQTRAKTIGILTDFAFHPYWEEGLNLDYVVTPNELLLPQALKKGFSKNQVLPFGIPIDPKFSAKQNKEEALKKLGLSAKKRTVLLMSGSMGYGHIESTVKALDSVPLDFQIVVVCGNNETAKKRIEAMDLSKPSIILGYVDYVNMLMDAADCIITKPGGLTTSEALAKGLPMIIVDPIPGQEDRNTEFLLNNGIAMKVTPTAPLDELIWQLFYDGERLDCIKQSISHISKPESTKNICEFAKKICGDNVNND